MSKSLLEHSGQISILKKEASKIVLLCNSGARNRVLFLRNKRPHRHVQLFNGLKVKSQFLFHVEAVIYAIFCVCVNSVQFRKSNLSNIENGTERNGTLRCATIWFGGRAQNRGETRIVSWLPLPLCHNQFQLALEETKFTQGAKAYGVTLSRLRKYKERLRLALIS